MVHASVLHTIAMPDSEPGQRLAARLTVVGQLLLLQAVSGLLRCTPAQQMMHLSGLKRRGDTDTQPFDWQAAAHRFVPAIVLRLLWSEGLCRGICRQRRQEGAVHRQMLRAVCSS